MNILLVKLSAIGDVVHTLPSLAAMRRLYPQAHITWVVEEAAADLIQGHPYLDRLLISRRKGWLKELQRGRINRVSQELWAFFTQLRERNYDLVLDFHGLFKSSLIVFLSSGRRRIGYDSLQELSGLFINEKVPEDMNKHAVDRYLDLVHHLGAKPNRIEFLIPVEKENETRVEVLLKAKGIAPDEPFVALNPLAFWETKLWNNDRFADVCNSIIEKLDLKVVLTGTRDRNLEQISSLVGKRVANLAGETSLKDLAHLYKKALLLVTTDSGPMHIAAAVGTKVVALFGPTDPARTGPYGPGHTVLRNKLSCSPCFLKKCQTKECMIGLTADQVFHAVKNQLGK